MKLVVSCLMAKILRFGIHQFSMCRRSGANWFPILNYARHVLLGMVLCVSLIGILSFTLLQTSKASIEVVSSIEPLPGSAGWRQIPNTKLSSVCSNASEVHGTTGCAAVISAWNGAIADTRQNRLIIWGGGHSDYFGNEVYALELNDSRMVILNKPTLPIAAKCQEEIGTPPAPNARHTYGGLSFLTDENQMWVFGGALAAPTGCASRGMWTLDVGSLRWTRRDPTNGQAFRQMSDIPNSDYDPVTRQVFFSNTYNGEFGSYSQATNAMAVMRTGHSDGFPSGTTSVVDPIRRLFLTMGRGFAGGYRLMDGTPLDWSSKTRGCGPVQDALYPGMAYYSPLNKIVLWAGGPSVYVFDPDKKRCQSVRFPAGPGPQQPNGTHGRFRYFPELQIFVLVNDWQEDAWVLRLQGANSPTQEGPTPQSSTGIRVRASAKENESVRVSMVPAGNQSRSPGPPEPGTEELATKDFQQRCAAPGVLVCEGFDDPARFRPAYYPASGLYPSGAGLFKGTIDSSITASGRGALRFEIDPYTSANSAGFWRQAFGKAFGPHSTFYVQFRFRISPEMLTQDWGDSSGNTSWKVAIFHNFPKTCGSVELTTQENYLYGLPIMYTECGGRGMFTNGGKPPYLKQQGDTPTTGYNCAFGTDYKKDPKCFRFEPNTWMTFYYQISIGDWGKPNSTIQAWVALPGQPFKQWVNMPNFVLDVDTPGNDYDSVDLLNYMTGKDPKANHATAYTWYDELIVSSKPIAAPKF